MDNEKLTVLAERGKEILIRIDGREKLGDRIYKTVRHEWWYDKDKMAQGIRGDSEGRIYCRGFAGSTDEDVIEIFDRKNV